MNLTTLDNIFWAAGFVGHAALLIVLLVRRRWQEFPIFTCLIGYEALVTITLFFISRDGSGDSYAVAYYVSVLGDFVFQLALILEIARVVLRPTGTWVRDARTSFMIAGAVGAVIALALCLTVKPLMPSVLSIWEVRGNLFTALLACELFMAMLYASNRLGLEWRNHVMGLAQGLTVWAFGAMASDLAHIVFGWGREFVVLDRLIMVLYLGALLYWIVTFWLPERSRAPVSEEMHEYLVALHRRVQYDLDRVTGPRKSS
ncbi:MAG TPA: hypothetical protein VK608_10065 [Edaphobacter sp.]|nr:hypothetical protein [Edaphobacter sp.]